jgi:uncharacterized SAM-binding protein YcdF (DUF218 family)
MLTSTQAFSITIPPMFPELKPYLTALIMPPMSFLILIFFGALFLSTKRNHKRGKTLVIVSTLVLALLSSSPVAVWLNKQLLSNSPELDLLEVKTFKAGAIVILGGGLEAPSEKGQTQLNPTTLDRLAYGVYLHRQTALPMLFSGGLGWGSKENMESEAKVSQRVAKEVFGVELKWPEDQSRDTQDNAINSFKMLNQEGITKIILVTNAWHMPRSLAQFKAAGFEVLPAPMGPIAINSESSLSWIPSAEGLRKTSMVLREALAIQVMHLKSFITRVL